MLFWAVIFFVLALVSACVGFLGAGTAAWVAKLLVIAFFVLTVVAMFSGRRHPA